MKKRFLVEGKKILLDEYYLTDTWYKKRLHRLELDNFECRLCGCQGNLNVHHKPSSYQLIPNESVENDLTTLCRDCHDVITNLIREKRYKKRQITIEAHPTSFRKELNNGKRSRSMANCELSAHRRITPNIP